MLSYITNVGKHNIFSNSEIKGIKVDHTPDTVKVSTSVNKQQSLFISFWPSTSRIFAASTP